MSRLASSEVDPEITVKQFEENLKTACKTCFRVSKPTKKINDRKSFPWWTSELTMMRKRANALRRLYQKTKHNQELREQRKTQYIPSIYCRSAKEYRESFRKVLQGDCLMLYAARTQQLLMNPNPQ